MNNSRKPYTVAVFGCGNVLFGDDGVGPRVIEALGGDSLPDFVLVEDVGTGIRERLFDYLLDPVICPDLIIIVDAVDFAGTPPGTVLELRPTEIPARKVHDFSLHQFPTVNMLAELEESSGIEIKILAVQVGSVPDYVRPGLSEPVVGAVERVCEIIMKLVRNKINREVNSHDLRVSCY